LFLGGNIKWIPFP